VFEPTTAPGDSTEALPDAEAFGRAVCPGAPRHRTVQKLHATLTACKPGAPLAERFGAIEALVEFLRSKRGVPPIEGVAEGESPQISRLRLLLRALNAFPVLKQRLSHTLGRALGESVGGGLFGRLGLPTDRGFFSETVDRFSRRFLPEPRDDRDLVQFVGRAFPKRADLATVAATPPELLAALTGLLKNAFPGLDPWAPLREHLANGALLLATRVSALGLSDVIRARSPEVRLVDSPFFKLPRHVDGVVSDALAAAPSRERVDECRALIDACKGVMTEVVKNLEQFGVSVDVVYRLELIGRSLDRLAMLVHEFGPLSEIERAVAAKALLGELVAARLRDRELGDIIRGNLHLLARKIIERAGHTGEHYITTTSREYVMMLLSAGGGGVLTTGTAALKFLTAQAHFAPFVEGVVSAVNYGGSFILMQLLGFTLATKQPSMTAAALAGTLRESADRDLSGLVSMIARITRSQLAAAIGNIGLVIPAAFVFNRVYQGRTGEPFLDAKTAEYVLHSLHPTQSGTIFFAALTGVLLWMSSIAAGWLENWAVYRRLPEAIAGHRMGRFVGRRTMGFLSRFFTRNISGFGGNAALGFFLGMTPIMGKFFGLPLDVRHVTLSTGALTLSICSLGSAAFSNPDLFPAMLGIAIIGSLNFGVSFVLALAVALRAREVERSDRFRLIASVFATFFRSPMQFFFPQRATTVPAVHGPVSVRPPPH
jgi:site-specific recombinase